MPLCASKSSVDKRIYQSKGTIAIVGAFIPTVDPCNVQRRQVEALEWHVSLDQNRGSQILCATRLGAPISEAMNEVTSPSTLARSGGGDDVAGSSEPPNGSHVSVAKILAKINGKLPPPEGDGSSDGGGIGATIDSCVKVFTTTSDAKTSMAIASGPIDGSRGDGEGGKKNESLDKEGGDNLEDGYSGDDCH